MSLQVHQIYLETTDYNVKNIVDPEGSKVKWYIFVHSLGKLRLKLSALAELKRPRVHVEGNILNACLSFGIEFTFTHFKKDGFIDFALASNSLLHLQKVYSVLK